MAGTALVWDGRSCHTLRRLKGCALTGVDEERNAVWDMLYLRSFRQQGDFKQAAGCMRLKLM